MSKDIKSDQAGKVIGRIGAEFPLISIRGYNFSEYELESFTLDNFGWLPVCKLHVSLHSGVFLSRHFPKDGDLISVFIRSHNNLFKPIRADFSIIKTQSSLSDDSEGSVMELFFTGILRIPNLYTENNIFFKDKTSFESLIELASSLGLGFVSNETETKDIMTWINPFNSHLEFMKNITKYSYKDENSFYDAWIDYYYNLNFVNINKLMSVSDDIEIKEGIFQNTLKFDYNSDENTFEKAKLMLTNYKEASVTNQFFETFKIDNYSGLINHIFGYKKDIYFYDSILQENVNFSISSMRTENTDNKNQMLGRENEDYYKTDIRFKWLGKQFTLPLDNVHEHYYEANIHNLYNNLELKKMNLMLNLPMVNFNLYRGLVLPVIFYIQDDARRIKVAGNVDDNPKVAGATIDRFLSGLYMILGQEFKYEKLNEKDQKSPGGKISQKVIITRREWTSPNIEKYSSEENPLNYHKTQPL